MKRPARSTLITTILDPADASSADLAGLHARRWEIESNFDGLKTHQRGPNVVLRSKTPDGVSQEIHGSLCAHYTIRSLNGPSQPGLTKTLGFPSHGPSWPRGDPSPRARLSPSQAH